TVGLPSAVVSCWESRREAAECMLGQLLDTTPAMSSDIFVPALGLCARARPHSTQPLNPWAAHKEAENASTQEGRPSPRYSYRDTSGTLRYTIPANPHDPPRTPAARSAAPTTPALDEAPNLVPPQHPLALLPPWPRSRRTLERACPPRRQD